MATVGQVDEAAVMATSVPQRSTTTTLRMVGQSASATSRPIQGCSFCQRWSLVRPGLGDHQPSRTLNKVMTKVTSAEL